MPCIGGNSSKPVDDGPQDRSRRLLSSLSSFANSTFPNLLGTRGGGQPRMQVVNVERAQVSSKEGDANSPIADRDVPPDRQEFIFLDDDLPFLAPAVAKIDARGSRVRLFSNLETFFGWVDVNAMMSPPTQGVRARTFVIDLAMVPPKHDSRFSPENTCFYLTTGRRVLEVLAERSDVVMFDRIVIYSKVIPSAPTVHFSAMVRSLREKMIGINIQFVSKLVIEPSDLPSHMEGFR